MSSTSATSNPVSVASNSSAGAAGGSVINVNALVSQLVAATQAPQQNLITAQTQVVTTQISALATLKGALSTFQSSLGSLDTPDSFNSESASSSNQQVFTATAGSGAPVGTYSIAVSQLAAAQQLLSNAFTGTGTTTVGTGTLQISLGGSSFNVDVTSTDDTLAGIASAINTAANNPGVTATIIQGTDGAHLLLSSSLTGAANTIQVSETDAGNALSALTYSSTATSNYKEQSQALDAQYTLSGVPATSSSNTITDALSGVTLNLVGTTAANSPATLTVSTNTSNIESNVAAFVSAYNTLAGTFSSLGGYDSSTGSAGPMMGNALLSSIQNGMRNALYGIVNTGSSTYNSLASIGITTNQDGTLTLNSEKLQTAMSTDFSAVSQLFSGASGVATQLNTQLTTALGANGMIASNSSNLTKQSNALSKQSADLTTQMAALTASLTQQYSALNTLLSSLQTTSSYLTQAFASLPQVQGSRNG
jgi:flagellar hook-associated protein 2